MIAVRSLLVASWLALGACAPEDVELAPRSPRTDAVAEASLEDGTPCAPDEFFIGHIRGRVVQRRGSLSQPVARAQITVCGSACIPGEARDDGRFELDVGLCFPASRAYPHGAVFQAAGSAERLDMYFDPFEGSGRRSLPIVDLGDYPVPSLAGAASARIDVSSSTPVELSTAGGARLRFTPSSIELPLSAEDLTVRMTDTDRDAEHAFRTPGRDDRPLAFVAIHPADTKLVEPAQIDVPNTLSLAPHSPVEIVALGNHGTEGFIAPGTLGIAGTATVSADGSRVVGSTRAFGLVGYRLARNTRPPSSFDAGAPPFDASVSPRDAGTIDSGAAPPSTPPTARTDRCRFFARTCLGCTAIAECGYVPTSGDCFPGSEAGPDPSVSPARPTTWIWFQEDCFRTSPPPPSDPCSSAMDCASCTARSACGWCAGRCTTGTSRGPSAGSCSDWRWVSTDCASSPPPPPPPPPIDSGVSRPDASTPVPTDSGSIPMSCAPPTSNFCGRPGSCNLRPFSLTDANTNSPWPLYGADYCTSRATVIVVSAGWCGACQREAPEFEAVIQRAYGPRGVRSVIALIENADRSPATVSYALAWQRRFGLTSRVTIDPTRQVSAALGLSSLSLPHTIVLDRTGRIRHSGFAEVSTVRALLDRILAE
jgi:thiol-disulfide isomerase/thioredoxin